MTLQALDPDGNEIALLRVRRDQYAPDVLAWMQGQFRRAMRPATLEIVQ